MVKRLKDKLTSCGEIRNNLEADNSELKTMNEEITEEKTALEERILQLEEQIKTMNEQMNTPVTKKATEELNTNENVGVRALKTLFPGRLE